MDKVIITQTRPIGRIKFFGWGGRILCLRQIDRYINIKGGREPHPGLAKGAVCVPANKFFLVAGVVGFEPW